MADNVRKIDPDLESFIRKKFTHIPDDENQEMIINIQNWVLQSTKSRQSLKELLDYSARTIYRIFRFKEIAIGVRDQKDGLYKYVTLIGSTKESEKAQRKLTYTSEEIWDYGKYPSIKLSTVSEFCTSDGLRETYNRPSELDKERESIDDFIEGDYIDISIFDSQLQLIAWMELGNPKDRKIPSKQTLLWVELFASTLGIMIEREMLLRKLLLKEFK